MRRIATAMRHRLAQPAYEAKLSALHGARTQPGDRLLQRPVFILSSIRSGSTLLRAMLNAHPEIHAPHELHLARVQVTLTSRYGTNAMKEIGLSETALRFLLWDRILHRELVRHGKQIMVNKTPSDALIWRDIVACWPDARFIYLLRHPAAVARSWSRARKDWTIDEVAQDVLRYMNRVEQARTERAGLTMRYEDITLHPDRETRRVCDYLGIAWDPAMLDYAASVEGGFRAGLGDWGPSIRSGKIQPVTQLPAEGEIPPVLRDMSARWGYLDAAEPE
jgi:hypothetical protein